MQRLIIDCDPGHDDAIAILYAAKHLDLCAITTVFGNASVAHTTRNALRICDLAGLDIPVAAGFAGPLLGSFLSSPVHGETGLDGARHLPDPVRQPVSQHAVDRIIAEAGAAPGSVALVAIGPLTNVAVALRKEPRLASWLHSISIMGGSTDIGNETAFAEANIFRDPEAADIVFRSGATIRMAGLNLTRQARIDRAVIARLRGLGGDVQTVCAGILEFYLARYELRYGTPDAPMHDPSAILPFIRPDLVSYRHVPVEVELASPRLRGMTACDLRDFRAGPDEAAPLPNVHVGMAMDGPAAVAHVFETIAAYKT